MHSAAPSGPVGVRHYARQLRKRIDTIPAEAMEALTHYHWPGNVRELQNVIERAVILSPGPVLRLALDELPPRRPATGAPAVCLLSIGHSYSAELAQRGVVMRTRCIQGMKLWPIRSLQTKATLLVIGRYPHGVAYVASATSIAKGLKNKPPHAIGTPGGCPSSQP